MKSTTPIQFVRHFHRWSGVALILIVGGKILSGFNAAGNLMILQVSQAYQIHFAVWIDVLLLFLFIGHSCFGVLKIIQGKVKNRVALFLWMTIIGLVVFVVSIIFIYFI